MKVLGVITARGGSKGIPRKNVKLLAGRPLIAYSIETARLSGAFDRLILSTDDQAIADAARPLGCEVPFIRPAELARDDTPHLPVMIHAVALLRDRESYCCDAVMILQPTSPLRSADDIRASIALLETSGADSVVSVSEVPSHQNPMRTLRLDDRGFATLYTTGEPVRRRPVRRGDMPTAWTMNEAIYLFRTHVLFDAEPSLYGDRTAAYVMPSERAVAIDDPADWVAAERAIEEQRQIETDTTP
jgi:CMP-N-acetylneuraminic acid synthetase